MGAWISQQRAGSQGFSENRWWMEQSSIVRERCVCVCICMRVHVCVLFIQLFHGGGESPMERVCLRSERVTAGTPFSCSSSAITRPSAASQKPTASISLFFFLLKCYKLLPSINLIFLSSPSLLHTRITNALESSALEIWVQFCKDLCCCVAPELWSSPLQTSAVFSPNLLFVSSLHISDILSLGELISY